MVAVRTTSKTGRAFTLMEMLVAVALLVLIIVGVGIVFSSAGRAVSVSQVTLELMSNTRAVQQQIERDIGGISPDGFIVIRSRREDTTQANSRRFDMISFLAQGSFPNRTGSTNAQPFTDRTVANAARVWYGQLVIEGASPSQLSAVGVNAPPTGTNDRDFILGRHTTLLLAEDGGGTAERIASNGITVAAHGNIRLTGPGTSVDPGNSEPSAHISSSRVCTAALTPAQVMRNIMSEVTAAGGRGVAAGARWEADEYCFRFKTLRSPYDTEVQVSGAPSLTNGYFRMHPIMLQGTASFAVDWSDGTTDGGGNLVFYGLGNPKADTAIEPTLASDDEYTAIFSFDNRAKWPKALRFRYRVIDLDEQPRLAGGREFTQIVRLPQ